MLFTELSLAGAYVVAPEPTHDERGFFTRVFCEREFAEHGLETRFAQHSVSQNLRAGTLRGMHFNLPPHEEAKLVTVTRGAVWDVIIDLRPGSPTYRQSAGLELSEENRLRLFIPKGFAHGFQSLRDDTEVLYYISDFYAPGAAAGLRHDDPAFALRWPLPISAINDKDRAWPDFQG